MSFGTWWAQYEKDSDGIMYFVDATEAAWNASRAESEAQLATALAELRTVRTQQTSMILEMSALQSERDALREALVRLQYDFAGASSSTVAIMEAEDIRKYMRFRLHEILSTPASGEPARKP